MTYEEVERNIFGVIKRWLNNKQSIVLLGRELDRKGKIQDIKLKKYDPEGVCQINLFKKGFFKDYEEIYNEIMEVNSSSK